jgi:hypothetical protein
MIALCALYRDVVYMMFKWSMLSGRPSEVVDRSACCRFLGTQLHLKSITTLAAAPRPPPCRHELPTGALAISCASRRENSMSAVLEEIGGYAGDCATPVLVDIVA